MSTQNCLPQPPKPPQRGTINPRPPPPLCWKILSWAIPLQPLNPLLILLVFCFVDIAIYYQQPKTKKLQIADLRVGCQILVSLPVQRLTVQSGQLEVA